MTAGQEQVLRLADNIRDRGLGPLAAFLIRANLPLTTLYAHVFMGMEPFGNIMGFNTRPYYEILGDRAAMLDLIDRLEKDSDGE